MQPHPQTTTYNQQPHPHPLPMAGVSAYRGTAQAGGSLGNNTKFVTPPIKRNKDADKSRRINRYRLQRQAAKLVPGKRVSKCCWCNISPQIDIIKNQEHGSTHYGAGLMKCGSVWLCPVCAAKITEGRRAEIGEAIEKHQAGTGSVFMVTFTLQHSPADGLHNLVTGLLEGYRRVQAGAPWQRRKENYQIIGAVRALEFTVSQAGGWHPHLHVLFFSRSGNLIAEGLQADFSERWKAVLSRLGHYASPLHGVDVAIGNKAASDYLAKMGRDVSPAKGLDFELAKGGQKTGREHGHFTPFQLLEESRNGNKWASAKFVEYAEATAGLNQIRWTPGLRDLLEIGAEAKDRELAEGLQDTGGKVFFTLEKETWQAIRFITFDMRGQLLEMARDMESGDFGNYVNLLLRLPQVAENEKKRTRRGRLWNGSHTSSGSAERRGDA